MNENSNAFSGQLTSSVAAEESSRSSTPAVKILGKTFHILETLCESSEPLSVVAIARLTELNRTTVHRTMQMLLQAGYVEHSEPNSSRFVIGPQILPLAARYLNQSALRSIALSHLYPLTAQIGARGHLGIRVNDEIMYLGGFEKPQTPTIYTWFGRKAPMHCCSLGKTLLACMPEEEASKILMKAPLKRFTPNTIVDPEMLQRQLVQIRKDGYAVDDQEHIPDFYCIGVPLYSADRPVASISIASRNKAELIEALPQLLQTAETISQTLASLPVR